MSDYISKKKLISHIETEYRSFGDDYDALQILGDIEDFPTEERTHGKWITYEQDYHYSNCSMCDFTITKEEKEEFNFCPNCGADMREEGDEK